MVSHYPSATYDELLEIRLRNAPTYKYLVGHEAEYMRAQVERGRRMVGMFHRRVREHFQWSGDEAALDIGCGGGSSLLAMAEQFDHLVGLDPGLPELILARKNLEQAGITNVTLVQAYGQRIPCPMDSFDYVNALNVLEHVFDLEALMREVYRVLKPGGVFAGDSRNRFDLFLPEPHVKVRWVGLMPRRWAARYVRWRRKVPYTSTWLLSYWELQRVLRRYFQARARLTFPYVAAYGFPHRWDAWLLRLEKVPLLSTMALWVFPSHLALAQK
jgi:ubiquinone/menaquinone biosynthesis C-methylase UbiE